MADKSTETVTSQIPQEGRTKVIIANDLLEKALAIRNEWNTNSDHPKGRIALEFATLLEEAALALTSKK